MPFSAMNCTARGWTSPAGREPALAATTRPPPSVRAKPSAICDRQEFSTQTKSRCGMDFAVPGAGLPDESATPDLPHSTHDHELGTRRLAAAIETHAIDAAREARTLRALRTPSPAAFS